MPIPLIIPALVAAAGTIAGASIQASSAKKNRISQEKQNAIDRKRAATAYQTAVSDMRAAGMNPITGQNPPQAPSTPMPAPQSDMTGVGQVIQAGSSAVGDLLQRNQQALQDQAMSFYQNQVNSTNDMINHLQDITHQYQSDLNQMVSGLSEDAKAYLNEQVQKFTTYSQKINSIEDSRQFSVEDLKKVGISVDVRNTNSESHTESEEVGGTADIGFHWENPITTIVDGITNLTTSSGTKEGSNSPGPGKPSKTSKERHNDYQKKESQQKREENKKGKGFNFDLSGDYHKTESNTTSNQNETGVGVGVDTTHGVKTVSGKTLKNHLMQGLSSEFASKTQDSGSQKINESLKSLNRNSYVRLVEDLVQSKVELVNYRRYAADLKRNPGSYLESYGNFVDGLKGNNENPYQAPSTSAYEQSLRSKYLSDQDNYPINENLKKKFPRLYEIEQELGKVRDPSLRDKLFNDFIDNIKYAQDVEYFKSNGKLYVPKKFTLK